MPSNRNMNNVKDRREDLHIAADQENDGLEIDLVALLYRLVEKFKWLIAAALVGTIAAGVITAFFITPMYESTAKLYVVNPKDATIDLSALQTGDKLTADYMQVFNNWDVNGFNAYVLCPHLSFGWTTYLWDCERAETFVLELIEEFCQQYPVDRDNIAVIGYSSGAVGAMYYAERHPELFSKLAVISAPYEGNVNMKNITIPVIGFTEISERFHCFMGFDFVRAFGKENLVRYSVDHTNLPDTVFKTDADESGGSDLIEWLFVE